MSRHPTPCHVPPKSRRRFQFNLRTMLALTALVAWMLGWMGLAAIAGLITLALLTLIETGCTRGAKLVEVLVRNLFAFFVCSLAFGAFGFGLMHGRNPTGWVGTDQFLFAPFRSPVEPFSYDEIDYSDPEDMAKLRARELRESLQFDVLLCTVVAVIAHRVLAGRARLPAYVLLWVGMAGLIYPLMGSWLGHDTVTSDEGWLARVGFSVEVPALFCFQCGAGMACLAGALVLQSETQREEKRLSLLSPNCHHLLVSLGLGLPIATYLIVPTIILPLERPTDPEITRATVSLISAETAALITATAGCYLWRRRFHWPLVLAGGFGALMALMVAAFELSAPVWVSMVGLVAGALVVLTSYLFDRLNVDDPGAAVAVHAVCGVWGALSIGLYGLLPDSWVVALSPGLSMVALPEATVPKQLLGVGVCLLWVFLTSAALFWLIRRTTLLPTSHDHTPAEPHRDLAREDGDPPREDEPKESADGENP